MIFLLLAIFSSAMLSIIMRLSDRRVTNNIAMLSVNYLACVLVAAAYAGFGNLLPASEGLPATVLMGCINGGLYLGSFALLQFNIRRNGVVLSSTFMKLGLLVSIIVSVVFFREMPTALQLTGFALAVAAIILINFKRESGNSGGFKAGLFLLLLGGGLGDSMAKIFEELGNPALESQFLVYTFAAALILCTALMIAKKQRPGKWEIIYGLLIGVPNYFSAKFLLAALETVPAVIVYPVCSVATILVVTVTGVLVFRERLEKRQWAGMGLILIALALLNI